MPTSSEVLAEMWEAHRARPYPRNTSSSERGLADPGDLMELDAYVAGYISRVVDGERLTLIDLQHLAQASLRIREAVVAMSGETRSYFLALAQLAELVESKLGARE
jgi:hypothetical protein